MTSSNCHRNGLVDQAYCRKLEIEVPYTVQYLLDREQTFIYIYIRTRLTLCDGVKLQHHGKKRLPWIPNFTSYLFDIKRMLKGD